MKITLVPWGPKVEPESGYWVTDNASPGENDNITRFNGNETVETNEILKACSKHLPPSAELRFTDQSATKSRSGKKAEFWMPRGDFPGMSPISFDI